MALAFRKCHQLPNEELFLRGTGLVGAGQSFEPCWHICLRSAQLMGAIVVAQLAELSLPIPWYHGSHPVISKIFIYFSYLMSTVEKTKIQKKSPCICFKNTLHRDRSITLVFSNLRSLEESGSIEEAIVAGRGTRQLPQVGPLQLSGRGHGNPLRRELPRPGAKYWNWFDHWKNFCSLYLHQRFCSNLVIMMFAWKQSDLDWPFVKSGYTIIECVHYGNKCHVKCRQKHATVT